MTTTAPNIQLTAHLLALLLRNDRRIRPVGPPRTRQEWGFGRLHDYLRALGEELFEEEGEEALWKAIRQSIALLPTRREEGLVRLVRLWGPLGVWLADQDTPEPVKPIGYRPPAA